MAAAMTRREMPKRKDSAKREDVPVRMAADVIRDARIIAAARDVSLAEYLSDAVRPIVAGHLDELQRELASRSGEPTGRPRRST